MSNLDWITKSWNSGFHTEYQYFADNHGISVEDIADKATGKEIKEFMLSIKEDIDEKHLIPVNIPDTFEDDVEYEFWHQLKPGERTSWCEETQEWVPATKEGWYFEGDCWAKQFSLMFTAFKLKGVT